MGGDGKTKCELKECKDKNDNCVGFVDFCGHSEYKGWLEQNCAKSCAYCGGGVIAEKECKTSGECATNAYCSATDFKCKCKTNYAGDGKNKCKRVVCNDNKQVSSSAFKEYCDVADY